MPDFEAVEEAEAGRQEDQPVGRFNVIIAVPLGQSPAASLATIWSVKDGEAPVKVSSCLGVRLDLRPSSVVSADLLLALDANDEPILLGDKPSRGDLHHLTHGNRQWVPVTVLELKAVGDEQPASLRSLSGRADRRTVRRHHGPGDAAQRHRVAPGRPQRRAYGLQGHRHVQERRLRHQAVPARPRSRHAWGQLTA